MNINELKELLLNKNTNKSLVKWCPFGCGKTLQFNKNKFIIINGFIFAVPYYFCKSCGKEINKLNLMVSNELIDLTNNYILEIHNELIKLFNYPALMQISKKNKESDK